MKLNFLNIRTQSQLKKNKTLRTSLPYAQAKSVGIVFTIDDKSKHDIIKEFIKKLEHDGKQVKVISFLPKKKENHEFLFDFFTIKDISFWGKITAPAVATFNKTAFDYLFCLDTTPTPIVKYILAASKAKCRIGTHNETDQAYFEFMLGKTTSTRALADELIKYSAQLR